MASALLAGCASAPDRFYTLSVAGTATGVSAPLGARGATLPGTGATGAGGGETATPVRLAVTVPALVDRNELVMQTGANGVAIFEHERWAAPLAGQAQLILSRDLEARRSDLIIGERTLAGAATISIVVDLVRMEARRGGPAVIEAQWRIHEPSAGADRLGSAVLSGAGRVEAGADLAAAYSADLGLLADRLLQEISRR
jgi:uncharacterized lipoprotein YmbA